MGVGILDYYHTNHVQEKYRREKNVHNKLSERIKECHN